MGESLGASILIEAAAIQPAFAALVVECPYADIREVAEYRVRQMVRAPAFVAVPAAKTIVSSAMPYARWIDGLNLQQVSSLGAIGHTSTPILLVHGLKDVQTPPASHSVELARANPRDPLWLVPNAPHTGAAAASDEFRSRVLSWFAEH